VDIGRNPQSMPMTIGGLRVETMRLHRFHTTLSKWATGRAQGTGCRVQRARD
jgi:hypothetical protein